MACSRPVATLPICEARWRDCSLGLAAWLWELLLRGVSYYGIAISPANRLRQERLFQCVLIVVAGAHLRRLQAARLLLREAVFVVLAFSFLGAGSRLVAGGYRAQV